MVRFAVTVISFFVWYREQDRSSYTEYGYARGFSVTAGYSRLQPVTSAYTRRCSGLGRSACAVGKLSCVAAANGRIFIHPIAVVDERFIHRLRWLNMGVIKHQPSGRRVTLATRSLVGRARWCVVRAASPRASGEHAVLQWDGMRWSVRDLGSTNGTYAGGMRLAPNERAFLEIGAVLAFGNDDERWTLEEDGPPTASARAEATGEVRTAFDGILALPDVADPHVTLVEDHHGRWMLEVDGNARLAVDQERIQALGIWMLHIPSASGECISTTISIADGTRLLGAMVLRFELSRDEEYIALSLVRGNEVTTLRDHIHHEMLLALARERRADQEAGLPSAEQGWIYVNDLLDILKLDLKHLNVNIFRARQHLARAMMPEVGALIERRSTTRQIRLGIAVEIIQP